MQCVSTAIKLFKDAYSKSDQPMPKDLITAINKAKKSALPKLRPTLSATAWSPEEDPELSSVLNSEQNFIAYICRTFYSALQENLPAMIAAGVECIDGIPLDPVVNVNATMVALAEILLSKSSNKSCRTVSGTFEAKSQKNAFENS